MNVIKAKSNLYSIWETNALKGLLGENQKKRAGLRTIGVRCGIGKIKSIEIEERFLKQYDEVVERMKHYEHIVIKALWAGRYGEFIQRFANEMNILDQKPNTIGLFVLVGYAQCNKRLLEIMRRNENVILLEDDEKYIAAKILLDDERAELGVKDIYKSRNGYETLSLEFTRKILGLAKTDKTEGEEKLAAMGVDIPYACVATREASYMKTLYGSDNEVRNATTANKYDAVKYLYKQGIQSVRMGQIVESVTDLDELVDYPNKYYDEFMDLYLAENCKFFLADTSGIDTYAMQMGKPIIHTNDVGPSLIGAFGGTFQRRDNLIIYKKWYDTRNKCYLGLVEMMDICYKYCDDCASLRDREGIELIENTPEEILDVVKEMNERLDGTWIVSEEDEELQAKYQKLITDWHNEHDTNRNNAYIGRIGAKFLRDNIWLLDNNRRNAR